MTLDAESRGIDAKTCMSALLSQTRPRLRERAKRIVAQGGVQVVERGRRHIEATVVGEDGGIHETCIDDADSQVDVYCDCPLREFEEVCVHVWALLVALSEETEPRSTAERFQRAQEITSAEAWRRELSEVEDALDSLEEARRKAQSSDLGRSELSYLVDLSRSLQDGGVFVACMMRLHLKSGELGKARPLRLDPASIPLLSDPLDRQIHEGRMGAETLYAPESGFGRGMILRGSLVSRLLPLIAKTGRATMKSDWDREELPLTLDEGEPWRFGVQLREDGRHLVLEGRLERGDERREMSEIHYLDGHGIVILSGTVAHYEAGAEALAEVFRERTAIRVPLPEKERVLEVLERTPAEVPVLVPSTWSVVETLSEVQVRISDPRGNAGGALDCSMHFRYGDDWVELNAIRERDGGEKLLRRNAAEEQRALDSFLEFGGQLRGRGAERQLSVEAADSGGLIQGMIEAGWDVLVDDRPLRRGEGGLRLRVRSGIDWFDLEGEAEFDGGGLAALPELLAAGRRNSRLVRLVDGSMGLLPEGWHERWQALLDAGTKEKDALRFKRSQGWLLDAMIAERAQVDADDGFRNLTRSLAAHSKAEELREAEEFHGELRAYQREGLGWLRYLDETGLGGCLADDMGLGKTVQVLAHLQHLKRDAEGPRRPALVVCPRSLLFNWVEEAGRFTPELKVVAFWGAEREDLKKRLNRFDLVVTTYGILRREIEHLSEMRFGTVILDEAQAIKNARSQVAKASRLLRADRRLALSGTPVENHLGELWSLFEFLNPGMLGRAAAFTRLTTASGEEEDQERQRALLARALRPFILRRTKEQVASDLPPKTEQIIHCQMEGPQQKQYEELAAHYREVLLGPDASPELAGGAKFQVLEALLRMRQAACHPGLVNAAKLRSSSAKIDALIPLLEDVVESDHKALIFSQFTSFLDIVRTKVEERGWTYEYLDGRTRDRQERVKRFQEDHDCRLFLISLKAGGVGLNLTAADYVFLLDPWWNPAAEAQAIDRTHRIGQQRPVHAYRLITEGTVEEKVLTLQANKRQLADAILGEDNAILRELSTDDLAFLLGGA